MAGIISYGAYVPLFRMEKTTKGWTAPGERSVANFDEDSITLGVEAAIEVMGVDRRSNPG